jgi:hypothetical protein
MGNTSTLPLDPIEEWLLHSHPNPHRVGCPGEEVLKKIADRSLPATDPARKHIRSCSPCYREFAVLRNQRRAAERMARQQWLRFAAVVVGVLLVAGIWLGIVFNETRKMTPAASPPIISIVLHLRDGGPSRGLSNLDQLEKIELPRKLVKLTIELPRFNPSGQYTVGLLKSMDSNTVMALAASPSVPGNGGQDVTVVLDLRQVPAGPYFLGTRRDNYLANYYPVMIREKPVG